MYVLLVKRAKANISLNITGTLYKNVNSLFTFAVTFGSNKGKSAPTLSYMQIYMQIYCALNIVIAGSYH